MKLWKILFAATCGACAAFGAEYHWTGDGGDGKWINPQNWREGAVPGKWIVGSVTNGVAGDVAVFGAVGEGAATTIDLTGQFMVKKVVVTNGAPAYVFGAETYYQGEVKSGQPLSDIASTSKLNYHQNLGFETSGELRVCKGVDADLEIHRLALDPLRNSNVTLINDSPNALVTFHNVNRAGVYEGYSSGVYLRGVGDFKYDGMSLFD